MEVAESATLTVITVPMSRITRGELENWLKSVATGARSPALMRLWLNELIIGDRVDLDAHDSPLIMDVFYRLNEVTDDDEFTSMSEDTLHVLTSIPDNEEARAMFPLAWGRSRLIEVLQQYEIGLLGDVRLRSFLKSGKWPAVAESIQRLDRTGRAELLSSLQTQDYDKVLRLLPVKRLQRKPRRRG